MRERFPGYYTPSPDEFSKLWQECLFLPDANILLHLFRYGANTTAQVLDVFERLKPRVWVPYRVAYEFHRRWRDVDQANRDSYDKLSKEIEALGRKLSGLFDEYTRHQTIDAQKEKDEVDKFVKGFVDRIEASRAKHPKLEDAYAVLNKLSDLVGDSVGVGPSDEQFAKLVEEGRRRFEKSIPPGLRDNKKEGGDAYGDYFIWKEALDRAKNQQKPIIIITDDVKDDWWLEFRGQKFGPRPELVAEMLAYAGQRFYLYTLSQFLDYATTFLRQKIDPAAIKEIKRDEVNLRKAAAQSVGIVHKKRAFSELNSLLIQNRNFLLYRLKMVDNEIDDLLLSEDPRFEEKSKALMHEKWRLKKQLDRAERNIRLAIKFEGSSDENVQRTKVEGEILDGDLPATEALIEQGVVGAGGLSTPTEIEDEADDV
ncbi:PIN-like domain-containing protein [Bradyrhizobium sp. HKCCYLS2038]|uniref:PIN-like domain-containing protein n=1 Tax=unclassified Bradyrhizobium TaxID=2631580 RepID=UPI003EBF3FA7